MSNPYHRIPNTSVPAQFHLQDDSSSYQHAVDERSGDPVGNLTNLAPVSALTIKERNKYVLDHEVFIKNIDIVSKNEASLHGLAPQFMVLLTRMHALKHTCGEGPAMRILCIVFRFGENAAFELPTWDEYPGMINVLRRKRYGENYLEDLEKHFKENFGGFGGLYSLEEVRRSMYELKMECVDISYSRYCEVKLRQSARTERNDSVKMYLPLLFSSISVILSLYNFFFGKK